MPDSRRAHVPLQPGRDTGSKVSGVAGGKQEAGVVAAKVGEEVRGLLEQSLGGAGGLGNRGE